MSTKLQERRKHAVHEFNDLISCPLCNGYLINPTTVDHCFHTYCRSCIVQYLKQHYVCPKCKFTTGKHINLNNLRADETLRSLIYKLVPGLYAKEQERLSQFSCESSQSAEVQYDVAKETESNIFTFTEPISLSLEYHPELLKNCPEAQNIPTLYLQCPGGVRIQHLKRFLRSKYDISDGNKRVLVEVIYENEILPDEFSLVDVGYCYNWRRNAPMKFNYHIIINEQDISANSHTKQVDQQVEYKPKSIKSTSAKSVTFSMKSTYIEPMSDSKNSISITGADHAIQKPNRHEQLLKSSFKIRKSKKKLALAGLNEPKKISPQSVKVIIARKHGPMMTPKKTMFKDDDSLACYENKQEINNQLALLNDYKSLRSNDMRYNEYTVVTSSSNNCNNINTNQNNVVLSNKSETICVKSDKGVEPSHMSTMKLESIQKKNVLPMSIVNKCDIVVSIPRSPLLDTGDDLNDNCTLAQLKTASSKKSIPTSNNNATPVTNTLPVVTKHMENIPRLTIELNSMKSKLTLPQSKSDVKLLTSGEEQDRHKNEQAIGRKIKSRKLHSYDDYCSNTEGSMTEHLDLETYARNIGLKPIDSRTAINTSVDTSLKVTNLASNLMDTHPTNIISSSHKKRKKKHSTKDGVNDGGSSFKRRKLHAEIFSHPADESLKMKVKFTATHNHRGRHKMDISRTASDKVEVAGSAIFLKPTVSATTTTTVEPATTSTATTPTNIASTLATTSTTPTKTPLLSLGKSNKKECEEKEMMNIESSVDAPVHKILAHDNPNSNELELKPLIPESPPLPPSLFKTGPSISFTHIGKNSQEISASLTQSSPSTTEAEIKMALNNEHLKLTTPKQCPTTTTTSNLLASKTNPNQAQNGLHNQQTLVKVIQPQKNIFAIPAVPNRKKLNFSRKFGTFCNTATNMPSDVKNSQFGHFSLSLMNRTLNKVQAVQDVTKQANQLTNNNNTEITTKSFPAFKCDARNSSLSASIISSSQSPTSSSSSTPISTTVAPVSLGIIARPKVTNAKSILMAGRNVNLYELNNSNSQKEASVNLASHSQISLNAIKPSPMSNDKTSTSITSNNNNNNNNNTNNKNNHPNNINITQNNNINGNTQNNNNKNEINSPSTKVNPPNFKGAMGPPLTSLSKLPKKTLKRGSIPSPLNVLSFQNTVTQEPLSMASLTTQKASAKKVSQCVHSPPLPQNISLSNSSSSKHKSLFCSSSQALMNLCNPVPLVLSGTSNINSGNDIGEHFRFSLCDFRAKYSKTMADTGNSADLSDSATNSLKTPHSKSSTTNVIENSNASNTSSLDAALSKIKPNLMSCTVLAGDFVGRDNSPNLSKMSTVRKADGTHKISDFSSVGEKLAMIYEKCKLYHSLSPAATVRPQNASVRNIPNPSALAFRNQQVPQISTAPVKSTTQLQIQTTSSTSSSFGPQILPVTKMAGSCNQTSPPIRSSKKPTTIDQVAANLNIRAAAAEANAAKAAAVTTTVSPSVVTQNPKLTVTSSPLLANAQFEIKTNSKNSLPAIQTAETTTIADQAPVVLDSPKTEQATGSGSIKSITTTSTPTLNTSMAPKITIARKNVQEYKCSSPVASSIRLEKITVD